ncbi:hypothetical protein [Paraburkholderia sp. GAS42]|uniref:hypothetical protein n=1 Tax=Paraburkholderia sp. GAS42 TaxID=3035135 RepID=UPI003D1C19C3
MTTTPPVLEEPCVQLSDWTVYETDKGTRHFVGREKPPYGHYCASEAIEYFDPQTGVGVDVTGQSYELAGLNGGLESTPGVWQGWVHRNSVMFSELTAEYRRAILVARVPVIERNGQPDYVCLNDIPQPWQDTFRAALHGSCCPVIDGVGECAWATDWKGWLEGRFPRW